MTLKAYQKGGLDEIIHYAVTQCRLGHMVMAATEKGVCCVSFAHTQTQALIDLRTEFPKAMLMPSQAKQALDDWIDLLKAYIDTDAPRPDLPLDIRGTVFQKKVWSLLLTLKDDEVIAYNELAQRIDAPKAVRAAASTCARNRIAVLIPCP